MKSAMLNTRIEVQHKVKTTDASGATVVAWQTLCGLWANVRHTSGAESIKADALTSVVKASIRIHNRAGISDDMRVILKSGEVYDVKAVLPDLQRREYLDLVCEKVSA